MEDSAKCTTRIPKIFENMAYGEYTENVNEALEWLKTKENIFFAYIDKPNEKPNGSPVKLQNFIKNDIVCTVHVPEIDNIKKILGKSSNKKWTDVDPLQRTNIFYKISNEIEKKAELFQQLEIVLRGILSKDTKNKAIPLLAQYFSYYSAFSFNSTDEPLKHKPAGTAVGVVSNDSYLAHLGIILAPALAAGCNVILQVGTKLAPVAFLLQDIAKSAGLPEETFRIIPSDDGELLPYLSSEHVHVLTFLVDLNNNFYRGLNSMNKKILVLTSYKTPAIIFDTADVDSAVDSVVESSWSYQSLLPWSTDTVLVQENILKTFLDKLKAKLKSLKVAPATYKSADISSADRSAVESLNKVVNDAKSQGIDVFRIGDCSQWSPTLLIGGKVKTNLAMSSSDNQAKTVTILPFRSIDEAVNLANNNRQGLWASVWSENVGIVNEVCRKLKVSNIWVNSSSTLICPEVIISPTKESGIGNFGGKEGYLEYLQLDKNDYSGCEKTGASKSISNTDAVVSAAKKAQETWQRCPKIQKQKIFQEFAEFLSKTKYSDCPTQTWLSFTLKHIYAAIKDSYKDNVSSTISGCQLMSVREPRGVIVIDKSENTNAQLILYSIFEGNSVILLTTEDESQKILQFLSQKLPSGVLNLVPYDKAVLKKLAANKQVNVYFGNDSDQIFRYSPLSDSKNYMAVSKVKEDLYGKINYVKNVWSDIGKSSTCNFS